MTDHFCLNGVDLETGDYLVAPAAIEEAAGWARGEIIEPERSQFLRHIRETNERPHLGLPFDVDPKDIRQAGWAVIFHQDEDPEVKLALDPLIVHRRKQIGNDSLVKVLEYRPGETQPQWLARYGVGAANIIPTRVPFYLLLIGDPGQIPFHFGHLLDVEYAVGRLHFSEPESYHAYVEGLIEYETAASVPNRPEVEYFATRHSFDRATQLSADYLIEPLARGLAADAHQPAEPAIAEQCGYRSKLTIGESATKEHLQETLQGSRPPAVLMTASHGTGWKRPHPDQRTTQGSLICQDWPGRRPPVPRQLFGATDLDGAQLQGLVAFLFACYSAGTPQHERFLRQLDVAPGQIADAPFIAALPQALLAHPSGGALAVVGHVERAWGCSIAPPQVGPQILPFRNALGRILSGVPLGLCLKDFNERFASLSTLLTSRLERESFGLPADDREVVRTWVARNDAEGYLLLGDPAARIRVELLAGQTGQPA